MGSSGPTPDRQDSKCGLLRAASLGAPKDSRSDLQLLAHSVFDHQGPGWLKDYVPLDDIQPSKNTVAVARQIRHSFNPAPNKPLRAPDAKVKPHTHLPYLESEETDEYAGVHGYISHLHRYPERILAGIKANTCLIASHGSKSFLDRVTTNDDNDNDNSTN